MKYILVKDIEIPGLLIYMVLVQQRNPVEN